MTDAYYFIYAEFRQQSSLTILFSNILNTLLNILIDFNGNDAVWINLILPRISISSNLFPIIV